MLQWASSVLYSPNLENHQAKQLRHPEVRNDPFIFIGISWDFHWIFPIFALPSPCQGSDRSTPTRHPTAARLRSARPQSPVPLPRSTTRGSAGRSWALWSSTWQPKSHRNDADVGKLQLKTSLNCCCYIYIYIYIHIYIYICNHVYIIFNLGYPLVFLQSTNMENRHVWRV